MLDEHARRERILRELALRGDVDGLLQLALRLLRDLTDGQVEAAEQMDPRTVEAEMLAARVRQAHSQGVDVPALSQRFGRSKRTIYRLLGVSRHRGTADVSTPPVAGPLRG